jgi:hypothetical protein
MSDRLTRERDLARRARQEMRVAVSNLRAGFGADLLSAPDDEPRDRCSGRSEEDEPDGVDERFTRNRNRD